VNYLGWSLLVFFGTLGHEVHCCWPIFLYFLLWPVGAVFHQVEDRLFEWLAPNPHSAPPWIWMLGDYMAGAFYILAGTLWFWFWGRVISVVATWLLPRVKEGPR
jgi:hypothetical protein